MIPEDRVNDFFAYARKRHEIYLKRKAGEPPPWTDDPIFQQYRFTNVFRELDKTTLWFKKYVRGPMRKSPEVFPATVLFRWFNTIKTGETLFLQKDIMTGRVPFDDYIAIKDLRALRPWLRLQGPPYVTGSYMIRSKDGMDKLDGVLHYFHAFMMEYEPLNRAENLLKMKGKVTLEQVWKELCECEGLGPFLAYEIVTDLRHTELLQYAPDIMTWANPGPGARRGSQRILGKETRYQKKNGKWKVHKVSTGEAHEVMKELLNHSSNPQLWPHNWGIWEMRDVEHTLCEFDKYERVRLGHGRPRQVFKSA